MPSEDDVLALGRALEDYWYWGAGPTHAALNRVFDSVDLLGALEDVGGKRERVGRAVLLVSDADRPKLVVRLVELLHEGGFLGPDQANAPDPALLLRRLRPFDVTFDEHGVRAHVRRLAAGDHGALGRLDALRDHIERIQRAFDHEDSELVLGSAKDLVESTAKYVLEQRGQDVPAKFPGLLSAAMSAVGLDAKGVTGDDETAKGSRMVLGGLMQVALGINTLRNEHGTGHGQAQRRARLGPRQAHLAAGAATVLANTMLETLEDPNAPWRRA